MACSSMEGDGEPHQSACSHSDELSSETRQHLAKNWDWMKANWDWMEALLVSAWMSVMAAQLARGHQQQGLEGARA